MVKKETLLLTIGATALAAAYVLVHEHRRKTKKQRRAQADQPASKEVLLKILTSAAEHARVLVERIRAEVHKLKEAKNLTDQQASNIFQQNFEHSLDQLIGAVRQQHGITEKAMDASFRLYSEEPDIKAAIAGMRAETGVAGRGGTAAASSGPSASSATSDAPLTKEKLKEVMEYNATLLEKELQPLKEAMREARRQGKHPEVDPQALMALQSRISKQVSRKYGVTDEQVMAAIDRVGAREDPAFKDILQRIADALNSALA